MARLRLNPQSKKFYVIIWGPGAFGHHLRNATSRLEKFTPSTETDSSQAGQISPRLMLYLLGTVFHRQTLEIITGLYELGVGYNMDVVVYRTDDLTLEWYSLRRRTQVMISYAL